MFNTKYLKKLILPIILYIVIGIIVWLVFYFVLKVYEKNAINWVTIFGTYSSLFALVITLIQVCSLRTISEETQIAVIEYSNKAEQLIRVSSLSRFIRIAREVREYLNSNNYSNALLRMYDLNDFLYSLNTENLDIIREDNPGFLSSFSVDLLNIEDAAFRGKNITDNDIAQNLENLIASLIKIENSSKKIVL